MTARLAAEVWVAAMIRRAEAAGGTGHVAHRGADGAGAVVVKLLDTGLGFGAPNSSAIERVATLDGSAWMWIVGPQPALEVEVDARMARKTDRDPDLWVLALEARDPAALLDEPILSAGA